MRDIREEFRLGTIRAGELEREVLELGTPLTEPPPLRSRREEEDHQSDGEDRRDHPSEHRPPVPPD